MDSAALAAAIRDSLDPQALVGELAGWVAMESPSHDTTASAAIAERLQRVWSEQGEVRIERDAGSHVLVEVPRSGVGDSRPVVLLGHSDTVWPVGTLDGAVPWSADGEVARGPGAYDMKAGLVVMLAAVRALRVLGQPHRPVRVVIAADEEVGSTAATPLVEAACADAVAVLGFESPHPDGALKVGRLGSTRVRLRVEGRESHAALDPEAGVSAIEELVDQLLALRVAVAAIQQHRPGEVLVNVGAISGGGRTNVVPGAAEALIGFRFATAAAQEDVMAALAALAPVRSGARLTLDVLSSRPAWAVSDGDTDLLLRAASLAAPAGLVLAGRPAAGAADTNTTGARGVPTLDGLGPRGGGAHAVSEHVQLDSLVDRVVLVAVLLAGL